MAEAMAFPAGRVHRPIARDHWAHRAAQGPLACLQARGADRTSLLFSLWLLSTPTRGIQLLRVGHVHVMRVLGEQDRKLVVIDLNDDDDAAQKRSPTPGSREMLYWNGQTSRNWGWGKGCDGEIEKVEPPPSLSQETEVLVIFCFPVCHMSSPQGRGWLRASAHRSAPCLAYDNGSAPGGA